MNFPVLFRALFLFPTGLSTIFFLLIMFTLISFPHQRKMLIKVEIKQ